MVRDQAQLVRLDIGERGGRVGEGRFEEEIPGLEGEVNCPPGWKRSDEEDGHRNAAHHCSFFIITISWSFDLHSFYHCASFIIALLSRSE